MYTRSTIHHIYRAGDPGTPDGAICILTNMARKTLGWSAAPASFAILLDGQAFRSYGAVNSFVTSTQIAGVDYLFPMSRLSARKNEAVNA